MRLIHAVRELNDEVGAEPITPDRALHRGRAHRRCSSARPTRRTASPASSSARRRQPQATATSTTPRSSGRSSRREADAAWVGWGFVAEHPAFAELCERLGHRLHRPGRRARCAGSATRSPPSGSPRRPASRSRPGAAGRSTTVERGAREHAERIGYPADDQGDRGRRRARHPPRRSAATSSRAPSSAPAPRPCAPSATAPCSSRSWSAGARHVEVQVIADGHGTAWALGVRDCIAAAPQPEGDRGVGDHRRSTAEQERELERGGRPARPARPATATPARSSSSTSPSERPLSFMEVNTRLQVEHPVTEATTGVDLVKLQLHVAAGGRLEGEPPARGRARDRGAAQRRGPRRRLRPGARAGSRCCDFPAGPGIRVDTGVAEGDAIPRRVRLDDRQDHRLGPRPRRGARPPAPRAAPRPPSWSRAAPPTRASCSTCSTSPEVRAGRGRHRLARPAAAARRARARRATPRSRCVAAAIELRRRGAAVERAQLLRLRPPRAARRPGREVAAHDRAAPPRPALPDHASARSGPTATA